MVLTIPDEQVAISAAKIARAIHPDLFIVARTNFFSRGLMATRVGADLVVVEEVDENLYLGARNIKNVDVIDVQGVNPVNLIGFDKVLFTVGALKKAEEMLG